MESQRQKRYVVFAAIILALSALAFLVFTSNRDGSDSEILTEPTTPVVVVASPAVVFATDGLLKNQQVRDFVNSFSQTSPLLDRNQVASWCGSTCRGNNYLDYQDKGLVVLDMTPMGCRNQFVIPAETRPVGYKFDVPLRFRLFMEDNSTRTHEDFQQSYSDVCYAVFWANSPRG